MGELDLEQLFIAHFWLMQEDGLNVLSDIFTYIPAKDIREAVDKAMETTDERIHLNSIKLADKNDQFQIKVHD